jgi:hypothetical protein
MIGADRVRRRTRALGSCGRSFIIIFKKDAWVGQASTGLDAISWSCCALSFWRDERTVLPPCWCGGAVVLVRGTAGIGTGRRVVDVDRTNVHMAP